MIASEIFGGGGSAAIGSVVAGHLGTNPDYLPLTGGLYLKADYPALDTSKMLTFGTNDVVTGPTVAAATYSVLHVSGNVWYAMPSTGTGALRSTDNGATWISSAIPAGAAGFGVSVANGIYFLLNFTTTTGSTYFTSPDGINWTQRTFPIANQSYMAMAYINGRYVAVPSYGSNTVPQTATALWSTDFITWTQVALIVYGAATYTGDTSGQRVRRPMYSPATGLVAPFNGTQSTNFSTFDGVNWSSNGVAQHLTGGTIDASTFADPDAAEDISGNLVSYALTFTGNKAATIVEKGMNFAPFPRTNIVMSSSNTISEDSGRTIHRRFPVLGHRAIADFSGSRLLTIDTGGVVRWLDIDNTRFRVPTPIQQRMQRQLDPLFIKAR